MAAFYFPRVRGFDFMAKMNLKVSKGSDRENGSGCNFTTLVIIHGQITYISFMKICSETKI